jgi:hypothetical protein
MLDRLDDEEHARETARTFGHQWLRSYASRRTGNVHADRPPLSPPLIWPLMASLIR